MTKTHDTLTAADALIIADALNNRAQAFDALVSTRTDMDNQTRGIWEEAARERRELACKVIDATKDGGLVPFATLLSEGARVRFMERAIARQCIADLLEAGFELALDDEEEAVLIGGKRWSTDAAAIFGEMFHTDECHIIVRKNGVKGAAGWVRFIYGNSGHDVVSDYTVNLEDAIARTNELAVKLEG